MADIVNFLIKEFGGYECNSTSDVMIFKLNLGKYNVDISVKDGTTLKEFITLCNDKYFEYKRNEIINLKSRLKNLEEELHKPFFNN